MHFDTTAPLGIALLGLLLGMRHATDPDHVIALTTILSRERRLSVAARIGIVWGLGHTLTVLTIGMAIIIFKLGIPVRLGLSMEFAVAVVLILLGSGSAAKVLRGIIARSAHAENFNVHSHPHSHLYTNGAFHRRPHVHHAATAGGHHSSVLHHDHRLAESLTPWFAARRPLLRSFSVGLVHGLAGSAAIALAVLSAIPQPMWATLYLGIFCLGTIIGMGLLTTAIATPFAVAAQRTLWLHESLVTSSGLLSFGFGLFLAYQLGMVDHLFSTVPIWTPH